MTGGDLRSGQVAAAAGVNVQTLRYYERRGLLEEPARTLGGHRLYPQESVAVLRVIKAAQRLGFTLEEVADGRELAWSELDVPVGKSTLSHHLKTLRGAGVTKTRQEGTRCFVRLRTDDLVSRSLAKYRKWSDTGTDTRLGGLPQLTPRMTSRAATVHR